MRKVQQSRPETGPAQRAPQAKAARLCPRPPDAHPTGGARHGPLSRLRNPVVRRLDPPHPGGHRVAPSSGGSYRACLYGPDLPRVSAAPSAHRGTGPRGTGAAAPRRQRAQPDRHAAGGGAAAHPQRPVVSGHRASVAPQRGSHRERHPSHGAAGPTGSGRDPGPHPRQPSGPRRRNRADETGWRQHGANGYVWTFSTPTERYFLRTLLPAVGSGAKQSWTRR